MAISRAYRKGKQSTKTNKKPTVHRHIAEGGRVCNLATDALLFAREKEPLCSRCRHSYTIYAYDPTRPTGNDDERNPIVMYTHTARSQAAGPM